MPVAERARRHLRRDARPRRRSRATHVEPGSALIGETPWHAANDGNERPAMVYVTEVTHELDGRAYTLGGGFYARSRMRSALVFGDGDPVEAAVIELPAAEIDYYGALQLPAGERARSAPPSSTPSARRPSSAALRSRSWPASKSDDPQVAGIFSATVAAWHDDRPAHAVDGGGGDRGAVPPRRRLPPRVRRLRGAGGRRLRRSRRPRPIADDRQGGARAGHVLRRRGRRAHAGRRHGRAAQRTDGEPRVGRVGAGARLPGLRHHRRHVPGHGSTGRDLRLQRRAAAAHGARGATRHALRAARPAAVRRRLQRRRRDRRGARRQPGDGGAGRRQLHRARRAADRHAAGRRSLGLLALQAARRAGRGLRRRRRPPDWTGFAPTTTPAAPRSTAPSRSRR